METVTSGDGTQIAFDRIGEGPAVILVSGALGHRAFDQSTGEVARQLAEQFTVFHYDRRGRGDSGDTPPYAVERELEDIEALLAEAGGSGSLYGSSSGGNLALKAAREGLSVTKLALWEPNFVVDQSRPRLPDDYVTELEERVADGRRGDAVEYFMTTAVGLPAEFVAPMREMPIWPGMEAVAHTLAYDGRVVEGFELPTAELEALATPTLVMAGGQTPWLLTGPQALTRALPNGEFHLLEGQSHDVAADAVAPELIEFFAAGA
jgi:pimeloyl-ACP methyl ester carboxylesterase